MNSKRAVLTAVLCAAIFPFFLSAADPFEVTVTPTGGGMHVEPVTVGSSNFLDLVDDVINAAGEFSFFETTQFEATLLYLGVPDAMTFYVNDTGTSAELYIASLDEFVNFTAGSRYELEQQIEDWFETEGTEVYADFLAAIAESSPAAVTDGNPTAATAADARTSFDSFGFTPAEDLVMATDGATSPNYSGFGLGFNSGTFKAGDLRGTKTDLNIPFRFALSEKLSLAGAVPIHYLSLEGAKIYGLGINLALPYRARIMTKENPLNWRITPTIGLTVRGSADLASGAALYQYGLINSIDYRINSKWIICMVNQLSAYESLEVSYDDYDFDPNISQLILKNGLRAVTKLSDRWILDGYVINTRFLEDAAVEQFWTLGVSGMFKLTKNRNLQMGLNYDFGDDYSAWSIGLSSAWKF